MCIRDRYKSFPGSIITPLLGTLKEIKTNGGMTFSQRRAAIYLIHKKVKKCFTSLQINMPCELGI